MAVLHGWLRLLWLMELALAVCEVDGSCDRDHTSLSVSHGADLQLAVLVYSENVMNQCSAGMAWMDCIHCSWMLAGGCGQIYTTRPV